MKHVATWNICEIHPEPVYWEQIFKPFTGLLETIWHPTTIIKNNDDLKKFASIETRHKNILIILGSDRTMSTKTIIEIFKDSPGLIIWPIIQNSKEFANLGPRFPAKIFSLVPKEFDSSLYSLMLLTNAFYLCAERHTLRKFLSNKTHVFKDPNSKIKKNIPEERFDVYISSHVRRHAFRVFENLGWVVKENYDETIGMRTSFSSKFRSVKAAISQYIRKEDKETIEKICIEASKDPNRRQSDLDLILYSPPDPECLAIAQKYGYYAPKVFDDLEIPNEYISYSEARTIWRYGSVRCRNKLLNFWLDGDFLRLSCNIQALYHVLLEENPDDQVLADEIDLFFSDLKSPDDWPVITREIFKRTYLYEKLSNGTCFTW